MTFKYVSLIPEAIFRGLTIITSYCSCVYNNTGLMMVFVLPGNTAPERGGPIGARSSAHSPSRTRIRESE